MRRIKLVWDNEVSVSDANSLKLVDSAKDGDCVRIGTECSLAAFRVAHMQSKLEITNIRIEDIYYKVSAGGVLDQDAWHHIGIYDKLLETLLGL